MLLFPPLGANTVSHHAHRFDNAQRHADGHGSYLRNYPLRCKQSETGKFLPALSAEKLSVLEADILENGCYTPITVYEDMVIIDGHNCYRICQKRDICGGDRCKETPEMRKIGLKVLTQHLRLNVMCPYMWTAETTHSIAPTKVRVQLFGGNVTSQCCHS